jgi:uncharacterized membrane protein YkvA (DUF1232 family)
MKMNYCEMLRKQIEDARIDSKDFEKNILYLPDIFNLLANLLDEEIILQEDRMLINCALAYLVVPSDVLPEEVYGAKGFMDDMYVCCVVIRELYKKYPDLMRKHWNNTIDDDEFDKVWDACYAASGQACEEENIKDKVLKYAGLAP